MIILFLFLGAHVGCPAESSDLADVSGHLDAGADAAQPDAAAPDVEPDVSVDSSAGVDSDGATDTSATTVEGVFVVGPDGDPVPAALACSGDRTQPVAGTLTSYTWPVLSFGQFDDQGQPVAVPGLEVHVFTDNAVADDLTCGEDCEVAVDNGDGTYSFEAPGDGWVAYRVLSRESDGTVPPFLLTMEAAVVPTSGEWFNTIAAPVLDGLYALTGQTRDPARTLIAGRVVDCDGSAIAGASIAMLHPDGTAVSDETALTVYFDGPAPGMNQETDLTGRFALANVDVLDGELILRATAPDGTVIACEPVTVVAGAMTNARLGPVRADGPAVCE